MSNKNEELAIQNSGFLAKLRHIRKLNSSNSKVSPHFQTISHMFMRCILLHNHSGLS